MIGRFATGVCPSSGANPAGRGCAGSSDSRFRVVGGEGLLRRAVGARGMGACCACDQLPLRPAISRGRSEFANGSRVAVLAQAPDLARNISGKRRTVLLLGAFARSDQGEKSLFR